MRSLVKLFEKLLAPAATKFLQALENPQAAQQLVQKEIFSGFTASEYGQSLGIQSLADWNSIPIVSYDDIAPWIEKEKISKAAAIAPEPILFYEKTSGSRGPAKWIPYTKSLRRSFNHMFCVWARDLIAHGPRFSTGKIYFCISPQLGNLVTPANGVTVGLEDDSQYLDSWLRWLLRPFLVSPAGVNRIRDPEEFKEKLCMTLLEEEKLEIVSIWSPSFLRIQLEYIQTHRIQIIEKLGTRISTDRAKLLLESEIRWTKVWPELKLISCWDSANAADGAGFLRSLFPGILIQGKGLLATEAPMTIPLIQAGGCVPVIDEVFFEFEDEAGKIHRLHEIEKGGAYSIIISQKGGLYRYRIGDRVRVSHFYLGTPCLEFLGRTEATSDLVGEKLHEEFVRDTIDRLALERTSFRSLVPATKPMEHYVLLLDAANLPAEAIAQRLDDDLSESPHYRQARLLGQLLPARVLVSRQIPETAIAYRMRCGRKWGDMKHPILATTPIDEALLTELERVCQDAKRV